MNDSPNRAEERPTAPWLRLSLILAGLAGAAGVALLAASAHLSDAPDLRTAAEILLFHAPALLALGTVLQVRRAPLVPVALTLLALGVCLFSGDLAMRTFSGTRLFAMAAPTGGTLIILGWAVVAFSAIRVTPLRK